MIEAIHKKNDLHSVLFAQILASNPQAAKSADVKERMEHKLLPFDEYQKAEIMEGLEWVSQKEMLEAEMTMILQERTLSLLTIAKEIAADENITDKSSAYLGFRCAMTRTGSPKGNSAPGGNQIVTTKKNTKKRY